MQHKVIEIYSNVHDNEVLSYIVDIQNKVLTMYTKYLNENVTISFSGLGGHRFENVTYCNIVFSIEQICIDYFVDQNEAILEEGLKQAFPAAIRSCEELTVYLKRKSLKVFEIKSSLGLSGFIFAEDISVDVKPAAASDPSA